MIDIYFERGEPGLGCLVMSTATTEAQSQGRVRELLAGVLAAADQAVARRIRMERGSANRRPSKSDLAYARIVTGTLVSFSTRARAGESRQELERIADTTAKLVSRCALDAH